MTQELPTRGERHVIEGIAFDIEKRETLFIAHSPNYIGFMVSARTMEELTEKAPDVFRWWEKMVADFDRDKQVIKAFADVIANNIAAGGEMKDAMNVDRTADLLAIQALGAKLFGFAFKDKSAEGSRRFYWRKSTDPVGTEHYDDLSELMAYEDADWYVAVPVTKVAEVQTGFAVRIPIHDSEGELEGDEIQIFNSEEEAKRFIADMTTATSG